MIDLKLIARRPMNRADWAWLMAAVLFGLFFATLATISIVSANQPRYAINISVLTNEHVREIIESVHKVDPEVETSVTSNGPSMAGSDYFQIFFGGIFGFVMVSYLFRIVVKICGRILGATTDEVKIVRGPSAAPGQARLAQDDRN